MCLIRNFIRLPVIIGTLPNTIANGQTADAVPLMADLNYIVNQVNANAQAVGLAALLASANSFTQVQSGVAATSAANFPIASQVQNQVFNTLSSTLGTNTLTARIAALALPAYAVGQIFTFIPSQTNTGPATLNIDSVGAKNIFNLGSGLVGGEIRQSIPALVQYDGTRFNLTGPENVSIPRSALSGLILSTAGSSATMAIAAGQATDSTNVEVLNLNPGISKTTSAWALGNAAGGLDTGAIANSTWYHFWLIMRPDTGVVDVLFSLSATAPTMPANYTLKRRIGSGLTTGGGNWTAFVQDGDLFQWLVPVANVNSTNPGAAAILSTVTTPTGITAPAYLSALLVNGTTSALALFLSDPAITDSVPDSFTFFSIVGPTAAGGQAQAGEFYIRTNTSAQIRYRLSASGANDIVRIATKGWIDRRGRDS